MKSAVVRVAVGRVNGAHNLVQNVNTLIMGSYIIAQNEPEILTVLTCPDTVQNMFDIWLQQAVFTWTKECQSEDTKTNEL